jgi:catechol 2,3-dioxygenase-like lactoylglutathione lyase family enzyme
MPGAFTRSLTAVSPIPLSARRRARARRSGVHVTHERGRNARVAFPVTRVVAATERYRRRARSLERRPERMVGQTWRDPMTTAQTHRAMSNTWPPQLQVGAVRFVRSSAHYDATVEFYRDLVGLAVIDEFHESYGEDGTIFGLPGWPQHLEIVRSHSDAAAIDPFDGIVLYLPDERAVKDATRRLRASGVNPTVEQHPYWNDWGGTTFLDPGGRTIVYVSWVYGPQLRSTDQDNRT